jgi:hypothetical protein
VSVCVCVCVCVCILTQRKQNQIFLFQWQWQAQIILLLLFAYLKQQNNYPIVECKTQTLSKQCQYQGQDFTKRHIELKRNSNWRCDSGDRALVLQAQRPEFKTPVSPKKKKETLKSYNYIRKKSSSLLCIIPITLPIKKTDVLQTPKLLGFSLKLPKAPV